MRLVFCGRAIRVLALAMLVCLGARADRCVPIRTTIVTTYSMGPDCTSPVGVCTAGKFVSPAFAGTTYFTAMTIGPGPSADMLLYIGELVISTTAGTITIRDHGFLNSSSAQFLEIQQVVGGTGAYAGAHGMLISRGISTAVGFEGTLNGSVCGPSMPVEHNLPSRHPASPGPALQPKPS